MAKEKPEVPGRQLSTAYAQRTAGPEAR